MNGGLVLVGYVGGWIDLLRWSISNKMTRGPYWRLLFGHRRNKRCRVLCMAAPCCFWVREMRGGRERGSVIDPVALAWAAVIMKPVLCAL